MEMNSSHSFCLIFLVTAIVGTVSGADDCDEYYKYKPGQKYENEANIGFYKHFSQSEEVFSYVVGFKFSGPIKNLTAYGDRISHKVSKNIWFVVKDYPHPLKDVEFDIKLDFADPVEIDEIFLNGEILCHRQSTDKITSCPADVLTPSLVAVCSVVLLSAIVALSVLVSNFKTTSNEQWYQTYNLVLSLDRRSRQSSNPNMKGIPLPYVPGEKSTKPLQQASYIELKRRHCRNSKCLKNRDILTNVINQLQATERDLQISECDSPTFTSAKEEEEKERETTEEGKATDDVSLVTGYQSLQT